MPDDGIVRRQSAVQCPATDEHGDIVNLAGFGSGHAASVHACIKSTKRMVFLYRHRIRVPMASLEVLPMVIETSETRVRSLARNVINL